MWNFSLRVPNFCNFRLKCYVQIWINIAYVSLLNINIVSTFFYCIRHSDFRRYYEGISMKAFIKNCFHRTKEMQQCRRIISKISFSRYIEKCLLRIEQVPFSHKDDISEQIILLRFRRVIFRPWASDSAPEKALSHDAGILTFRTI